MFSPEDKRQPATVWLRPTWVFELDKHDTLLVLKALGGRLTPDEVPLASDLCDRLTTLRATSAGDSLGGLVRAAEKANAKQLQPTQGEAR